jgi:hypothetical protein
MGTFKTEDIVYAAAVIDTDGCLMVTRRQRKGPDSYYTNAQVGMTKEPIVFWLYKTFGGHLSSSVIKNQYALLHRWSIKCRQSEQFIRLICPYLKLKREQAELCLQLLSTFPVPRSTRVPSIEILELRKSIWERMRILNARGAKRTDCVNLEAGKYYEHRTKHVHESVHMSNEVKQAIKDGTLRSLYYGPSENRVKRILELNSLKEI